MHNTQKPTEKEIDKELDSSFPASDPPSWTPGETKVKDRKSKNRQTGHSKTPDKKFNPEGR